MIVDRILKLIEVKGINKTQFYKQTGLSNGFLDKVKDPGGSKLEDILIAYPEVSSEWLLTGSGMMFKSQGRPSNLIPLYNDVASIGGTGMVAEMSAVSSTTEFIDAGDLFPGATAAIRHYEYSMVEYPVGCILILRKVEDQQLIAWGKNYCIETSEYRVTKSISKSVDKTMFIGYSSNVAVHPNGELKYPPIEIPKYSVLQLFKVLGHVTHEESHIRIIQR